MRVLEEAVIHTFVAYALDWNYGRACNEMISALPEDAWACFLDHDAMFTTPIWYRQLCEAIAREPDGTFVARTNRAGKPLVGIADSKVRWQIPIGTDMENHDMRYHRALGAKLAKDSALRDVTDTLSFMCGVMFLISKATWRLIGGFREAWGGMDWALHSDLKRAGRRLFCLQGVYVYHWKRADGSRDYIEQKAPFVDVTGLMDPADPRLPGIRREMQMHPSITYWTPSIKEAPS